MVWQPAFFLPQQKNSLHNKNPRHIIGKLGYMNLKETSYWLSQLFPPGMAVHKAGTFHIATWDLGEEIACSTVDFSTIDFGLETTDEQGQAADVRTEIFTVAYPDEHIIALLNDAASLLTLSHGALLPQPGTIIRGISTHFTASHGILIAPYVWEQGVPRVYEHAGTVGSDRPTDQSRGRLTTIAQLLMLTEDELNFGIEHGMDALQKELDAYGVDLLDLHRKN